MPEEEAPVITGVKVNGRPANLRREDLVLTGNVPQYTMVSLKMDHDDCFCEKGYRMRAQTCAVEPVEVEDGLPKPSDRALFGPSNEEDR